MTTPERTLPTDVEFSDPSATVVWAGICALDEALHHEVLDALAERLAVPEERSSAHCVRVARAVAARRDAAKALDGRSPSVAEYRKLRERNPEFGWPLDSSIRGWLGGGWNDVLRCARLDAIPEPLTLARRQGPQLTQAEILAAIQECARELDKPIAEIACSNYTNWVRQPSVRSRSGRRPA